MLVTSACGPPAYYVSQAVTDALNAIRQQAGLPGGEGFALYTDSVPPGTAVASPCAAPLPRSAPPRAPVCWPAADVLWSKDLSLIAVAQDLEQAGGWAPAYYTVRAINVFTVCEQVADMACVATKGLSK